MAEELLWDLVTNMANRRSSESSIVVAIPVKNEARRIAACLDALAIQRDSPDFQVVLLLNNCIDASAAIVRRRMHGLPFKVHLKEVQLPLSDAHAGRARSLAMHYAADLAGPEGILLTTDADGCVYSDWLSANIALLRNGCDAVAGRAEIDLAEAALIPAALHDDDARECAYAAMLDEIGSILDPDISDPWPRHSEHSGASIAVTVKAYRRAGGVPPVSLGEDRAFYEALKRTDARIRHAPGVRVIVSGRIEGRAIGGMADTIRRRMTQPDKMIDDRLEPAIIATRRSWLRSQARTRWTGITGTNSFKVKLATELRLGAVELSRMLDRPYFGSAWAMIEQASPVLVRHPVPVADLAGQSARAASILRMLSGHRPITRELAGPGDIAAGADARLV